MDAATRQKISVALTGRPVTPEFRAKMSAIRRESVVARVCPCGKRAERESPHGWVCPAHFSRWRRTGDFAWERPVKEYRQQGNAKTPRELALQARGITLSEVDEQLERQGGACALCGGTDPGQPRFSLDHDHSHDCQTNPLRGYGCPECIRGLLCRTCNLIILPILERGISEGLVIPTGKLASYLAARPFKKA